MTKTLDPQFGFNMPSLAEQPTAEVAKNSEQRFTDFLEAQKTRKEQFTEYTKHNDGRAPQNHVQLTTFKVPPQYNS